MDLQQVLINTRTALEEQISALDGKANTEYLWRQWFYLQNRIIESNGGTVAFDYDKLGEAIATAVLPTPSRKIYKPMLKRVREPWTLATTQSMTVFNKGNANGTLQVDGNTFLVEPGETHSWSPPGENILCEVSIDGTGTILVVDYLEEIAN